mmetsp:Transcript_16371/g.45099  ORF Transcript_16371/g.45099 Transcript_16371/m.45099 type:complete len:359 (-) Transcript_16371:189-1265(-)
MLLMFLNAEGGLLQDVHSLRKFFQPFSHACVPQSLNAKQELLEPLSHFGSTGALVEVQLLLFLLHPGQPCRCRRERGPERLATPSAFGGLARQAAHARGRLCDGSRQLVRCRQARLAVRRRWQRCRPLFCALGGILGHRSDPCLEPAQARLQARQVPPCLPQRLLAALGPLREAGQSAAVRFACLLQLPDGTRPGGGLLGGGPIGQQPQLTPHQLHQVLQVLLRRSNAAARRLVCSPRRGPQRADATSEVLAQFRVAKAGLQCRPYGQLRQLRLQQVGDVEKLLPCHNIPKSCRDRCSELLPARGARCAEVALQRPAPLLDPGVCQLRAPHVHRQRILEAPDVPTDLGKPTVCGLLPA